MASMRVFGRKRPADDLATREANLVAQIHIYAALAKAMDRRQEVFDLLVAADDVQIARSDLQALLEVDEVGTQAVMDLQLRRLPAGERNRIMAALAEMQASLDQVRSDLAHQTPGVG
jgi:DNA gyrase subunit A